MKEMFINTAELTGQTEQHITYVNEHIGIHNLLVAPFEKMQQAALEDGISIDIASGFRSFARQQLIFDRKMQGSANVLDINNEVVDLSKLAVADKINSILLYSALPGASRHHWGTDIDVYSKSLMKGKSLALEAWEYEANGPLAPLTEWLDDNMQQFGFYRPYDKYRGGVAAEPWHLSYQPLASMFSEQYSQEVLAQCIQNSDMVGKEQVLTMLDTIYCQYVTNVGAA
ncbi:M15 family metallopeptidase [Thalassomonas sp. M1454]|uniref:M15 family metallopeptidase n=1 Tax=Thalassomonas sp. M1454 TaxID=2594477 RepID=UPI00118150B7|nr:M15 family metallopeptidase [Thalassomonas sp. M1454]TRX56716.1 M15 family metallopeptidase [Thalassomonas sp. M1454]